jgi:hypothetical protein
MGGMTVGGMQSGIAMLAPLPAQLGGGGVVSQQHVSESTGNVSGSGSGSGSGSHERWERLEVLFQSVRNNARGGYEYPGPSVAALESVLIRLYLESPMRGG